MITCPNCGHENADTEAFCTKCETFLRRPKGSAAGAGGAGAGATGGKRADRDPAAGVSDERAAAEGSGPTQADGPEDPEPPESIDAGGNESADAGPAADEPPATTAPDEAGAPEPIETIIIRPQPRTRGTPRQPPPTTPDRVIDGATPAESKPTVVDPVPVVPPPNTITCWNCGHVNPVERELCEACPMELRPAVLPISDGAGTIKPRFRFDRMTGVATVAVIVAVIALAALILRPDDGPVTTASPDLPTTTPDQTIAPSPVAPSPSATGPVVSEQPSVPPSQEPTPLPEPVGLIAFHSNIDGNQDIWTVQADGRDPEQITTAPGRDWDPDLSWDGERLTWGSPDGIVVADVDGGNSFLLTHHHEQDINPAWSADDDRIAYSSTRDREDGSPGWELYVREVFEGADNTETITLTSSPQADYEPSWSPDGLALVFTRAKAQGTEIELETADLFTIVVPASPDDPVPKAVALTDNDDESIVDEDPAWSPVGGKIAFSRTLDGGKPDLWILDLVTKEEVQLTDTDNREEHDPTWSPDGKFIAYQANGVIRIIRIADKEVFRLDLEGRASHATWRK